MGEIGNLIKQKRESKGYSQRELARLTQLSHSEISRIESGKRTPTQSVLWKLAPLLDMEPTDLLRIAGYLPNEQNGTEISLEDKLISKQTIVSDGSIKRTPRSVAFSSRLRQLREEVGLSRDELSKKLNITYAALTAYELGRIPTPDILSKIADYFTEALNWNVTTDYLLCRTDTRTSQPTYIVYDGLNLGWEPGPDADEVEWKRFIEELISAVKPLTEKDRKFALDIIRAMKARGED